MNFDFLEQEEYTETWMKEIYHNMAQTLAEAEGLYWDNPRQCGILLRSVAEQVCRVYNRYYEVGFPQETILETFLSYTEEEAHNVLVSRFLSVVRKEQRDRLILLRVLGDDCIAGEEQEKEEEFNNRMSGNARRMMNSVFDTLKTMCRKVNGREGLEQLRFSEEVLPRPQVKEEKTTVEKKSFWARILGKRMEKHKERHDG